MPNIFSILKKITRNDLTYVAHRILLRSVYGNRVQGLANRDMFHRPEWFWGARGVPVCPLARPASTDGLKPNEKKLLVSDLLRSFEEAQKLDKENTSYSPLWRSIIERSAQDFVRALCNKDAEAVLHFLEAMFSQPALWGIGYGDLGVWQGDRFRSFVILHQLVGLAESLGVIRTECPEQGEIGYAFEAGIEPLVSDVEKVIGTRIDFPKIGSSYGITIGDRLLDMQTPIHIYAAYRLRTNLGRFVGAKNDYSILEIGAGFGGSAFWFLQLGNSKYTILDLALTNVYQGWFLANALGRENVMLFSDLLDGISIGARQVSILPVRSEERLGSKRFDAVFNQDSFPEMNAETIDGYLRLTREHLDGILYSFNHESYSLVKGKPQPWVADRIAKAGGLVRLSRELSWVRRGYVEEVYRLNDPKP